MPGQIVISLTVTIAWGLEACQLLCGVRCASLSYQLSTRLLLQTCLLGFVTAETVTIKRAPWAGQSGALHLHVQKFHLAHLCQPVPGLAILAPLKSGRTPG